MRHAALVSLCLALVLPLAAAWGQSEVAELGKTLSKPLEKAHGLSVPPGDPRLKAIHRLTQTGTPEAVGVLKKFLTTYGADRKLRQHALVALGKMGSREAVQAIRDFESWAEKRRADPAPFTFGRYDHAMDHFSPQQVRPLVQWQDDDDREHAAFRWHRFGQWFLYRTTRRADGTWEPPVMLGVPGLSELANSAKVTARVEAGKLVVQMAGEFRIPTSRVAPDRDKDGTPDAVERLLGTAPGGVDTDNDGVPDSLDGNPMTPKHRESNDPTEIRQAVFTVLFATCANRDAIFLVEKEGKSVFVKQEYYGFAGYVVKTSKSRPGQVNVTSLTVKLDSPTTATATINDWEGSLAASGHQAKLKKIHGKWVVVDFRMTWIS